MVVHVCATQLCAKTVEIPYRHVPLTLLSCCSGFHHFMNQALDSVLVDLLCDPCSYLDTELVPSGWRLLAKAGKNPARGWARFGLAPGP